MKTFKRIGVLSVIMAVALLIPADAAEARHRSRSGVNVWVGPGGVGYSQGYGGYSRGYRRYSRSYGGYNAPYYQPQYYSYPSRSYYYSYPSYGSYYNPSQTSGGYVR